MIRVHNTHYTIQVFIDYTSIILHEERKLNIRVKEKLNHSDSQDSIQVICFLRIEFI